jgi:hypothetical protein
MVLSIVLLLITTACNAVIRADGEATATPTVPAVYQVQQPRPGPACSIFQRPEMSVYGQNIYAAPDENAEILGLLTYSSWIVVTERVNGWYHVRLPDSPVDGGWVNRGGVLLDQPCSCYPGCAQFVPNPMPPNRCNVVIAAGTAVDVYYQPDTTSDLFASVADGVEAQAMARTLGSWIGFDPGVAQADNLGMDRLRWVQEGPGVSLDGPECPALPVYMYVTVR